MCHAGMLFVPSLSPFYAFAVGYCVLLLASLSPIVSLLVSLLRLCCWMLRPPSSCLLSSLPSTPLLLDAVPAFSPTVSLLVLFFFPFLSPFYAFVCCWMLLRFWQASLIVPLACLLFCFSPSPCWWRRASFPSRLPSPLRCCRMLRPHSRSLPPVVYCLALFTLPFSDVSLLVFHASAPLLVYSSSLPWSGMLGPPFHSLLPFCPPCCPYSCLHSFR